MNKKLLIFRHTPIDVDIKMYEYFAKKFWIGQVFVYAETSFKSERNLCGYKEIAEGINTIILDESNVSIDDNFFTKNEDSIFIFYGIPLANKYLEMIKKHSIQYGIVSERDISLSDKNLKATLRKLFPIITYTKNKYIHDNVKCFLAMGMTGVNCFKRYFGVDKNVLFDFMYNDGNMPIKPIINCIKNPVRFVYVGRFDYKYKGVDILLEAVKELHGDYTVDLIGGYGADAEDVVMKTATLEKVTCYGPCQQTELCNTINRYDVIIIPSKQDGWNLHCSLAINAGIGVIVTNEAVSHELIEKCGNGIVIDANNANELRKTLHYVINNPSIIADWKKRTEAYTDQISYEKVAKYLYDILNYSFSNKISKRPSCPWI